MEKGRGRHPREANRPVLEGVRHERLHRSPSLYICLPWFNPIDPIDNNRRHGGCWSMSVSSINERITLHTHNGSFFQIDLNAYPLACCPIASLPRYVFFILRSIPPSVHSSTALPPYPLPDHPASDAGALHLCSLHDETTTPANITTAVGVVLCFF